MHKKHFSKVWVSLFVVVVMMLAAKFTFFSQGTPTISDVLRTNNLQSTKDLSSLIAALLAFSFAALSLAKGYEIFRRDHSFAATLMPQEDDLELEKEAEDLKKKINELSCEKDWMLQENTELKGRIKEVIGQVEEIKKVEDALRNSNISLSKECERLTSEGEEMMLELQKMKPKSKAKVVAKAKTVVKKKAKVKRTKKKK